MPKAILLAFTNPGDERSEPEYNQWYDSTHVPDVLDLPGVVGGRRFSLSSSQMRPVPDWAASYLAIYELDVEDLDALLAEWSARSGSERMPISPAVRRGPDGGPTVLVYDAR